MIPTIPDLTAMLLKVGEFVRDIGPFILLGAAAAVAQRVLLGNRIRIWTGYRLIAPVAAIPLGVIYVAVAALRSWFLCYTGSRDDYEPTAARPGAISRTLAYLDGLILPFIISALIGAIIVVLTPTEPLWTWLSPPEPWRLFIAPLVAGALKPRGGTELPLILALITKGLDPAGALAGIAGAGYRHARSIPLAVAHIGFGVAVGVIFWISPLY
jgi:uncharacterized membrane protein YraQ (UPF0718 family)